MSLETKLWTPISVNVVIAAFLQGEKHRFPLKRYQEGGVENLYASDAALIDQPNLDNPHENHRRLRLFYLIRGPMMTEIPPDTQWFKVSNLVDADFGQLHIIARCGWDATDHSDNNELLKAAIRNQKTLRTPPTEWASPILWGHGKDQPLTIVEGNNRLAGYVLAKNSPPPQYAGDCWFVGDTLLLSYVRSAQLSGR